MTVGVLVVTGAGPAPVALPTGGRALVPVLLGPFSGSGWLPAPLFGDPAVQLCVHRPLTLSDPTSPLVG